MKIHSDKITSDDLHRLTPKGCYLEVTRHGSRSRDHAFNVGLSAEPGTDAHGIKRCFARNTGQFGGQTGPYGERAATYIEWGDWMVELFKIDPDAIIGTYKGSNDFIVSTHKMAPYRPNREDAEAHADRWSGELYVAAQKKLCAV